MNPWLAVQTRPRHEKMVAAQLSAKGYEIFTPTYRVRRRWADRVKMVVLPLFEGYVFCRLDVDRAARIITTPGVTRIVSVAGVPAVIEEAEIAALQRLVASRRDVEPWSFLQIGERVRIEAGPLAGIEGILESMAGRRCIVVSITLLQRSVAVEIDRDAVGPVSDGAGRYLAREAR